MKKNSRQNPDVMKTIPLDAMFSGIIGKEYDMLKLVCPLAAEMSRLVGWQVSNYQGTTARQSLEIIELGGGTGITTLNILTARDDIHVTSVDNEPTMQNQAKKSLYKWLEEDKLCFDSDDALTVLRNRQTNSVDIIASAYTLHNFLDSYRNDTIREIFRVLKPGGQFVNADRYALDDISAHTRMIQEEVSGYFSVLTKINRLDLLEQWIIHLFSDESGNHVMREGASLNVLRQTGFSNISISHRQQVNALLIAEKPI